MMSTHNKLSTFPFTLLILPPFWARGFPRRPCPSPSPRRCGRTCRGQRRSRRRGSRSGGASRYPPGSHGQTWRRLRFLLKLDRQWFEQWSKSQTSSKSAKSSKSVHCQYKKSSVERRAAVIIIRKPWVWSHLYLSGIHLRKCECCPLPQIPPFFLCFPHFYVCYSPNACKCVLTAASTSPFSKYWHHLNICESPPRAQYAGTPQPSTTL